MKIEDVKKMLSESNAIGMFEIYVPSLQQKFTCKQMTIGQRKTATKTSMTSDNIVFYRIAMMSIISECCPDLPINKITLVDFISILSQLRLNSHTLNIKLKLHCSKCEAEFIDEINFAKIIENCNNFKFKSFDFSKQINESLNIKMKIAETSLVDFVQFEKCKELLVEENGEDDSDNNTDNRLKFGLYLYPTIFIRDIHVNDDPIDNYLDLPITDRFGLITESLPSSLLTFEKDENIDLGDSTNLISFIYDNFSFDRFDNEIYHPIVCPECNFNMEGVYTYDNFFND